MLHLLKLFTFSFKTIFISKKSNNLVKILNCGVLGAHSVQFLKKIGNKYKNRSLKTSYFSLYLKNICVYLCFGKLIFFFNECLILIRGYYFGVVKYL